MPEVSAATVSIDAIYEQVTVQGAALARIETAITEGNKFNEQRLKVTEDRVERHGARLLGHDDRLNEQAIEIQGVRSDVRSLQESRDAETKREVRRATWPQVVGAIGVIIAGTGGFFMLITTLSTIADALSAK